ncbi:MAG: hypothetical protein AAB583_06185 [Patescibacteria group bacterium]
MRGKEQDLSENAFRYLPRTEQQVAAIAQTLRQVFQLYLQTIQSSRRFMDEGERHFLIGDVMHDVRKYKLGDGDGFVFYSESRDAQGAQERKTVELKTDRNYVGIETGEVISHKVDEEGRIIGKTSTIIDLSRGTYVEQQVEPIPAQLQDQIYNKQTFTFNSTRDTTSARLIWSKDKEEHPIITITPTEETISFNFRQIRTDHRTGERLIVGPEGTIRLPCPDEFIAGAIKKVVNLEPVTFSLK